MSKRRGTAFAALFGCFFVGAQGCAVVWAESATVAGMAAVQPAAPRLVQPVALAHVTVGSSAMPSYYSGIDPLELHAAVTDALSSRNGLCSADATCPRLEPIVVDRDFQWSYAATESTPLGPIWGATVQMRWRLVDTNGTVVMDETLKTHASVPVYNMSPTGSRLVAFLNPDSARRRALELAVADNLTQAISWLAELESQSYIRSCPEHVRLA